MEERLQIDPATKDYLDHRSIKAHVAKTREAVGIYTS